MREIDRQQDLYAVAAVCAPKLLNRETLPMSDTRRLAESYVETFRDAVEAINDFGRGGHERSILYEGRPVRIGYVIGVASHYRDVIPPDLHRRLCEVALPGEEPEDITFAAGARALRARYNDIMKQRRINSEAQVPSRWVLNAHPPGS